MGVLAVALAQWEQRDDSRPRPEVRRTANTAMEAIDATLRDLHAMRARLVSEIRVNDAAVARVDAMPAVRITQSTKNAKVEVGTRNPPDCTVPEMRQNGRRIR